MNPDPNVTLTAENWIEAVPFIGDYPVRPYKVLAADHYCAPAGFYEIEDGADAGFAFQPGWSGQDGGDAVYFHFSDRPTLGEVRERIASLLVSSWLVQDRGDAGRFFLGDDGSIEAPWGIIPADVLFAPRGDIDDAPWENLNAILADVDKALAKGAPPHGGYVDWRLRNTVPATIRTGFSLDPDGDFGAHFTTARDGYVVVFLWAADGTPRGGVREDASRAVFPVPEEADLAPALLVCA